MESPRFAADTLADDDRHKHQLEEMNVEKHLVTRIAFLPATILLLASSYLYAASVEVPNHFDAGETHGWTAGQNSARPTNAPDGGPNGDGDGFLLLEARGGNGPGSIVATFNNDDAWTGDFAAPGITGLSVDMMNPISSTSLSMRLVLFGPNGLNNRWTSTVAAVVPADGEWRNFAFSIDEADLTRVGGSSTYNQVIGDVVRLMLRNDAGTPSAGGTAGRGKLGIDNIRLVAGSPLDCNGDGSVDVLDLDCANLAGITSDLLADLNLIAGDLDGKDGVAFADFLTLANNFGSDTDRYTQGNIDGIDGVVFADFLILAKNFGKTAETLASVPEPSGIVTLILGLFAMTRIRRRCAKHTLTQLI